MPVPGWLIISQSSTLTGMLHYTVLKSQFPGLGCCVLCANCLHRFSSTQDVSFLLKTFWSLPISTSKSFCLRLDLLMENSASGSFLRNRRLESFLETKSGPNVRETQKIPSKQVITRQRPNKTDAFVDDDGWIPTLISCVRIVTCFLAMMVTTFIWAIVMLMLLPWPSQRIRQGNIYGHVTGRLLMWILGNPLKIEGTEFSNERAIYICNHASPIDIFLIMWLTPTGTVGIAKKEIIWYPLFGQLYVLANHLRIDRSDPRAAIKSMKRQYRLLKNMVYL